MWLLCFLLHVCEYENILSGKRRGHQKEIWTVWFPERSDSAYEKRFAVLYKLNAQSLGIILASSLASSVLTLLTIMVWVLLCIICACTSRYESWFPMLCKLGHLGVGLCRRILFKNVICHLFSLREELALTLIVCAVFETCNKTVLNYRWQKVWIWICLVWVCGICC